MTLLAGKVLPVAGARADRTLESFRGQRIHAVAGIGNPWRFFADLRGRGLDIVEHAFPDHHAFMAKDLDFGDTQPVLMTEKDAVKCAAFADERCWYVPVTAEFSDTQSNELVDLVLARVKAFKLSRDKNG
jgi:tetraacyldisaccharide 4'-kinase